MSGQRRDVAQVDEECVRVDREWLRRGGLDQETQLVVDHGDGGLLLIPARPDARRLYLEPTSRCNLACAACMRHAWDEAPGEMPDEVFAAVMAQLPALPKLESVHCAGFGEPLTHPRFFAMLRALREYGLRTEFTTNGLLLDDARVRQVLEARVHAVVVSVDGVSAAAQAEARDGCDLELVFANLSRLVAAKKALGTMLPWVGLEFVATRRNYGEFQALIARATELKLDFLFASHLLPYTQEMSGEILYGDDPVVLSAEPWQLFRWSGFNGTVLPKPQLRTERYCRFVERDSLVVAWDGAVSPCYGLMHGHTEYVFGRRKQVRPYALGNVRQRPLADIWMDPEYVRFRSRVRRFAFPSCGDCLQADACYFSQSNEEDCWGNTPSCGDCLWGRGIVQCY